MSYLCWFLFPLRTAFSFPLCVFKYLPFLLSQPTFHTIHKAFSLNLPIIQMEAFSSAKEPDSTNTEGDSWSCSVAQSCLTLRDSMNRSTPGLPAHHQLPDCGVGRGLSGLHWLWCNGRRLHLEWTQEPHLGAHRLFCHCSVQRFPLLQSMGSRTHGFSSCGV